MNNKLWQSLANAWKIPELRAKLLFTAGMLAVYRFGAHVPVPGIDTAALKKIFEQGGAGVLGFLDLFSGGALAKLAVFALGIMPYITASIIMQLLTVVIPKLEALAKEGEQGQKEITKYTRYLTVGLSLVNSLGYVFLFRNQGALPQLNPRARGAHRHHVDHRRRGRHVAGRAHHRARDRQRHVDHHLHEHHLAPAVRPAQLLLHDAAGSDRHRRHRHGRHRGRHLGDDGRAPRARAVRQACRRAAHDGRHQHLHPAQGQHGRRHTGHLRFVHDDDLPDLHAVHGHVGSGGLALAARSGQARGRTSSARRC